MGSLSFSRIAAYLPLLMAAVLVSVGVPEPAAQEAQLIGSQVAHEAVPGTKRDAARLLLVGDIMLGRQVETILDTNGADYVFEDIRGLISEYDVAIGNFEASIAPEHRQTPDFGMQFSVKPEYLKALKEAGFDVLSLANNHALDYGAEGLSNTRMQCDGADLICGGMPYFIADESTQVLNAGDHRIGILFLNAVDQTYTAEDLRASIDRLSHDSEFQIAYVHWGNEYETRHSEAQASLAHALIDTGIDTVIGHHPHVIQDIEIYKDAAIFYSLGNFIFDQYFSTDVQEGLMVDIELREGETRYVVHGMQSIDARSKPAPMNALREAEIRDHLLTSVLKTARVRHFSSGFSIKH